MRARRGLLLLGLVAACGGGSHSATTPSEVAPPAWEVSPCATTPVSAERDDERSFVVTTRERMILGPSGIERATDVPDDPFAVALHFGPIDGPWVFVTSEGGVAESPTFLGALTPSGTLPDGMEAVRSRGAGQLFASGTSYLVLDATGVHPLRTREGHPVIAAAVDWPGTVVVLDEPHGELSISHDQGADYSPIVTDGERVADLFVDDDGLEVRFADDELATLEGDTLGERHEERYEDEYAGEEEYASEDEYADQSEEVELEDADAPVAVVPPDPWCSALPVDVVAHWDPASVPPATLDELGLPERCHAAVGLSVVTAECTPRHVAPGHTTDLLLLDPTRGGFRSLGPLPGGGVASGSFGIASPGSRAFVLYHQDLEGALHAMYFDGDRLTPLSPPDDAHVVGVHDDLAILAPAYGATRGMLLVRLPDLTPVPLDLPGAEEPYIGTFAADGALVLLMHTPAGAESDVPRRALVGRPGAWTEVSLPAGIDAAAFADAQHGLAATGDTVFATEDGARTWTDLHLDPPYGVLPECTLDGCALGGTVVFRRGTGHGGRQVVAIPHAEHARSESSQTGWRCALPAMPEAPSDGVEAIRLAQGEAVVRGDDEVGRTLEWWGAAPTGAFHGTAPLGDDEDVSLVGLAPAFAVLHAESGLVIARAAPTTIAQPDELAGVYAGSVLAGDLPDGGMLVVVTFVTSGSARPVWAVRLDARGEPTASEVLTFRTNGEAPLGIATGPDDAAGVAIGDGYHATAWDVHVLGASGQAAVRLAGSEPVASAVCAAPTPWTLQTDTRALHLSLTGPEREIDDRLVDRVWLGVGGTSACVAGVASDIALPGLGVPMLYADHGAMRPVIAGGSPTTMTCTTE